MKCINELNVLKLVKLWEFGSKNYCNVHGVLYSRCNFIALQKVNTLQLNTVSNSSNSRTRPTDFQTRTVPEHSFL
jgi:hypothetical protein